MKMSLENFQKIQKMLIFLKGKLAFLEENQMEQKFPVRNFEKNFFFLAKLSSFQEIPGNALRTCKFLVSLDMTKK